MEPVRTGFSTYIFAGDGVTNVFPLQFTLGELKRSYVTCQVADEVDGLGNPVYRELIEVPGDPSMIQIGGTVPAVGAKIEFKRVVPKDLLLHLYANGSILDYPSLDESHLQLMMAMHEVLDGIGLKNVYTDINMHGYKLTNVFADPNDPDSIATVAFLGTYRQDALGAAVAAANSAIEALGYRNAAQHSAIEAAGYRNTALMHANTAAQHADSAAGSAADSAAAAQVSATNAANNVSALLAGYVVDAQTAKAGAELAEDGAQAAQLAAEAISTEAAARAYNYIINGNFDIWQRAASQTTSGYGSDDRWFNSHVGTTKTHSRQSFSVGETFPDGTPAPTFYSRTVVTSVTGVGNCALKLQRIERVRTLAGKRATLSFYAKADANKSLSVELNQIFGTGGAPSAMLTGIGARKISLTNTWQKFVITVYIPNISGKTIGTENNDNLQILFWFDAGSSFNTRTNNLGHQSGTFDIACVSLVEGDVDVKPIPRSYGEELALCQRYYEAVGVTAGGYAHVVGTILRFPCYFTVAKRVKPNISMAGSTSFSLVASDTTGITDLTTSFFRYEITSSGIGQAFTIGRIIIGDAEL